ncbi:hypothetical protein [Amycolatopsis minnesotensis]
MEAVERCRTVLDQEIARFTELAGGLHAPEGELFGTTDAGRRMTEAVRALNESVGGELDTGARLLRDLDAALRRHTGSITDVDDANAKRLTSL